MAMVDIDGMLGYKEGVWITHCPRSTEEGKNRNRPLPSSIIGSTRSHSCNCAQILSIECGQKLRHREPNGPILGREIDRATALYTLSTCGLNVCSSVARMWTGMVLLNT